MDLKTQHKLVASHIFISTFILLLVTLNITVGTLWVGRMNGLGIVRFIILQIININVAYGLTEFLFYLFTARSDLPAIDHLHELPRAALLYTTCDDIVPVALAQLGKQDYEQCDVYILDDSVAAENRKLIDNAGFCVVRRNSRKGFKAGNLNNWLREFGSDYQYIIVLDSDSIVGEDFVSRMIAYAEHPKNRDVVVFQSKMRVWNVQSSFARALSVWYPLWYAWTDKTANRCEMVFSWGHNCLYRLPQLIASGGFYEDYIAEDYATSIRLIKNGYKCRFVDIISYEAAPTLMRDYTKRATRWAKQTLQLFSLDMDDLPFTSRLHIFMNAYSFGVWLIYIPGMFLATWGSSSSIGDLYRTLNLLLSMDFFHTPLIGPVFVMLFLNIYFFFSRLPIAIHLGISWRDYFSTLLLVLAMGPYIMLPLLSSQLRFLFGRKRLCFEVTNKENGFPSFSRILIDMRWGLFLMAFVVVGIFRNPNALIWNFTWIIPFIASPVIIYAAEAGKLCWSENRAAELRR